MYVCLKPKVNLNEGGNRMEGKGIKTHNMLCSSADIHLNTASIKKVSDTKDIGRVS